MTHVSDELKDALQTAVSIGTIPEQHRGKVGHAAVVLASAVFKLLSEASEMDVKLAKLGTIASELEAHSRVLTAEREEARQQASALRSEACWNDPTQKKFWPLPWEEKTEVEPLA